MRTVCKTVKALFFSALLAVTGIISYYNLKLPDSYYITDGSTLTLKNSITVSSQGILPLNYTAEQSQAKPAAVLGSGSHSEQLMLWGIFPIKTVTVTEVDARLVIPCGTPFGIKMTTEGVMVVELSGFDNGTAIVSPAKDAGISEGDLIVSISGQNVHSNKDVSEIISESGGDTLGVTLIRNGESKIVFVRPEKSAADNCYHAGMWVRDSSAGIGTVTFYNPATQTFAGLGHPVCDPDTGEMLTMAEGSTADVYISGVKKSVPGDPGELMGAFISSKSSGTLDLNCKAGVYGTMYELPAMNKAVEVAMRQEVVTGEAEIYATINGTEPEIYKIYIEKIDLSERDDCRNMVIKVTDERLLKNAGGIVQGMSGSPIIQNGKLVGAVTHVLISDPEKGYAIFADTMLEYADSVYGS